MKFLTIIPTIIYLLFNLSLPMIFTFSGVTIMWYFNVLFAIIAILLIVRNKWYGSIFGVLIGLSYLYEAYILLTSGIETRPLNAGKSSLFVAIIIIAYYIIIGIYIKLNYFKK